MKIKSIKKRYKIGVLLFILSFVFSFFLPFSDFIANKIALEGSYQGHSVGFTGSMPMQYVRYVILKKFSDTNKLKDLYINHNSPAVKCYAFRALLNRNVNHLQLLEKGLNDEREIITQFGCIASSSLVGDLLIAEYKEQISDTLHPMIDSLLLYSNIQLNYKNRLLKNKKLPEKYYNQVLKLVKSGNTSSALVALAKYQKSKDTVFIKQALKDTIHWNNYFQAIGHFPLKTFERDLITIHEQHLNGKLFLNYWSTELLYEAIISIKSDNIKKQLQKVIYLDNYKKRLHYKLDSLNNLGYKLKKNVSITSEIDTIQLFDTCSKSQELILDKSIVLEIEKFVSKKVLNKTTQISDLNSYFEENSHNNDLSRHKKSMYKALKKAKNDYYNDILSLVNLDELTKKEIETMIEFEQ